MPAIGSEFVFEVRDIQIYGAQTVMNVYHFRQLGGAFAENAVTVANAFDNQVLSQIVEFQYGGVTHTLIECEQLGSLTNYAEYEPTYNAGQEAGPALPVFCAARFDYLRSTKETRSGYKRIAGLTEDGVNGNQYESAYLALMETAAAAMADTLTTGSFTLLPVIVGGRYDTSVTPKELKPVSEWIYNPITDVVVVNNPTTQNSRKLGRGI